MEIAPASPIISGMNSGEKAARIKSLMQLLRRFREQAGDGPREASGALDALESEVRAALSAFGWKCGAGGLRQPSPAAASDAQARGWAWWDEEAAYFAPWAAPCADPNGGGSSSGSSSGSAPSSAAGRLDEVGRDIFFDPRDVLLFLESFDPHWALAEVPDKKLFRQKMSRAGLFVDKAAAVNRKILQVANSCCDRNYERVPEPLSWLLQEAGWRVRDFGAGDGGGGGGGGGGRRLFVPSWSGARVTPSNLEAFGEGRDYFCDEKDLIDHLAVRRSAYLENHNPPSHCFVMGQ